MAKLSCSLTFEVGPEDEETKAAREKQLNEAMETSSEPDYLLENDLFNPGALIWLLSNKCIALEGLGKYAILDACEVVAPKFMLDTGLGQSMFQLLGNLQDDEEARIPGEWTNLVSSRNFGYDDLAYLLFKGWTIADICSSNVCVECDERLALGIPDAFSLFARMIWHIRNAAGILDPFTLNISVKRFDNEDEFYLEEMPPVFACDTRTTASIPVDGLPPLNFNGPTGERPFDGGTPRRPISDSEIWDMEYINDRFEFEKRLCDVLNSFPFETTVSGGTFDKMKAEERIKILPGDLVTLKSVWDPQEAASADDVITAIKVFDREKTEVGYLMRYDETWDEHFDLTYGRTDPKELGSRELACLLPYVIAVVSSPTENSERAAFKVRLTLDTGDLTNDQIVEKALETMRQPYPKRMLLSKGPFVASDLERWGSAPVPDTPNPAPEGYDNPVGKRKVICENILALSGKSSDMLLLIKAITDNVLKHIESANEGWYYDSDELHAAKTFLDYYQAMDHDIREYISHAFGTDPTSNYVNEKGTANAWDDGENAHWVLWINSWIDPIVDDVEAFLDSVNTAECAATLIWKTKNDDEANIIQGTVNIEGGNQLSFSSASKSRKTMSVADMRAKLQQLSENDSIATDDYCQRSILYALDEALNNGMHEVFNEA